MPKGLINLRFHVTEEPAVATRGAARALRIPEAAQSPLFGPGATAFNSDELAARFYLNQEMELDQRAAIRALTAPEDPGLVPNLDLQKVEEQPLTGTRLVQFRQSQAAIPVFGSHAFVELSNDRGLVSVDAEVAPLDGLEQVSPEPTLSADQVLERLALLTGQPQPALATAQPPTLMLYYDEAADTWHLAYFIAQVPAAPLQAPAVDHGHGPDPSARELFAEYNYLIDAHAGALLFVYPAHALLAIPSLCLGLDEGDVQHEFFGHQFTQATEAGFELFDPQRNLRTCDHQFQIIDPNAPVPNPVRQAKHDWAATHKAAISAHVNAMHVWDFYNDILQRKGVDNQGMALISMVNCLQKPDPTRVLRNAFWWKGRMWYGQDRDQNGTLHSMARYLDIIAHELTHGVTETTAGLVYANQSGALNESFSDIFGVIINNWYTQGADSDVATWNWEIGPNWNGVGRPLRDLSQPQRTGMPDHMQKFLKTFDDYGGVHTNSNIHNKAAHNVLTALDAQGLRVFKPREVAILYYLTLTHLPPQPTFAKVLQVLCDVAATLHAGDADQRQRKLTALRSAYSAVGIAIPVPA